MNILDYIKQKMAEAGKEKYQIDIMMAEIPPRTSETLGESSDHHVTVNVFSPETIQGDISGSDELELSPAIINSTIAKVKMFDGQFAINNRGNAMLYVEYIKVIPLS